MTSMTATSTSRAEAYQALAEALKALWGARTPDDRQNALQAAQCALRAFDASSPATIGTPMAQSKPKPRKRAPAKPKRKDETSIEVTCPRCKNQHTIAVADVIEVEAWCARSGQLYTVSQAIVKAKVAAARTLPAETGATA